MSRDETLCFVCQLRPRRRLNRRLTKTCYNQECKDLLAAHTHPPLARRYYLLANPVPWAFKQFLYQRRA